MVGFSVATLGGFTVTNGNRIPYEIVQTNAGGRYDSQLHEFVCPDTGFYLFTTSQFAVDVSDIAIMLGGQAIAGTVLIGYTCYAHASLSRSTRF